jgi:predicted peptidase
MKKILTTLGLVGWLCLQSAGAADEENNSGAVTFDKATLEPGRIEKIDDPRTGGWEYWTLYVPKDYTPDRAWPILYCYHRMDQEAQVWPFRELTDGVGYIIVGMEYLNRKVGGPRAKKELANLKRIHDLLAKRLRIDDKLQFIGGFSQGGWETAHIAEAAPQLFAGMIITGAGRINYGSPPLVRGQHIFIGVGEQDGNRTAAEGTADYYRKRGAQVVMEIFKGLGHDVDTKNATLKTWLKDRVAPPGSKPADLEAGGQ